jgi:hypothetical protein
LLLEQLAIDVFYLVKVQIQGHQIGRVVENTVLNGFDIIVLQVKQLQVT